MVSKVLPYINGLVIAIRNLFEWCGKMLGIDLSDVISSSGTGYSDAFEGITDEAEDVSDGLDSATDSAKELKNELMGFDEVNKLSDVTSSSKDKNGSGASGQIDLTKQINKALEDYEKVWNKSFDNMENSAEKYADSIANTMKKVAKEAKPTTTALNAPIVLPFG